MGLKVGIIGLPNVGKSTLFNALLGRQQALTAPYPFATIEPNVGVVDVPDGRLEKLRDEMFPKLRLDAGNWKLDLEAGKSKVENQAANFKLQGPASNIKRPASNSQPPLVFATVTFVDIAGLVKGASQGQGLGNQFLSHIRDVDLILHVLRDFDEGIPRAQDSRDPEHDAEIVKTELELKDLEVAERKSTFALAGKPVIYAVNVGEDKLPQIASYQFSVVGSRSNVSRFSVSQSAETKQPTNRLTDEQEAENGKQKTDNRVFYFCAKVEEEISKMAKNEQKEYLKVYGLNGSCLDRMIGECFRALGLISFFTAGVKEVRAWPTRRDSPAPAAAGMIHSDFEKLFIRAEVIGWEKLVAGGSWQVAKERGWVRTEGRDYLVKDGEVINFLIGK